MTDGVATLLPDPSIFLYLDVRKEAVPSFYKLRGHSRPFQTCCSSENDVTPGVSMDDVQEVSHYVSALNHGLTRLRGGFPLSARLFEKFTVCSLQAAAERRRRPVIQNQPELDWGDPTWQRSVHPATRARSPQTCWVLERFLHDQPERTPLLIKAALAHVQFCRY